MKLAVLSVLLLVLASFLAAEAAQPIKVRVFVITMFDIPGFGAETKRWVDNEGLTDVHTVPGLSPNFPSVKCTAPGEGAAKKYRELCVITTDIGYANAATSMTAVLLSGIFDFEQTYFLVAGIGGIDPADGTTGSAAWARYVVDFGLAHEIDAREMPAGWPYGYTGFGPVPPGVKPTRTIGTEVYQLNEALLQKALALTSGLNLAVNDRASTIAYRSNYPNAPANQPPTVIQCDSMSVDTYWHGTFLSQRANDWARLLTNNASNYCNTNEEDAATLTALKRGSIAELLDFNRVAVLRTASNFDQQYPGQVNGAYGSLTTSSGGFLPSLDNAYLVGSTLAHDIYNNWALWENGVP